MIELLDKIPPGSRVEPLEDGLGVIAFLPDGSCQMAELRFSYTDGWIVVKTSVPKIKLEVKNGYSTGS